MLIVDDTDGEVSCFVVERARRDHLRAAEREVPEFVDAYLRDVACALHDTGVAGHHALDVGDDHDLVGRHVVAEHHRGRVRAAAAERGDRARVVLGEEAGDDRDHAVELVGERLGAAGGLLDVDLAPRVGDDRPVLRAGFEEGRVDPAGRERGLHHPCRGPLAHAHDLGAVGLVGVELDLPEEVVGGRTHRADDHRDLVARLDRRGDRVRRPVHPRAAAEARPAELGYDPHRRLRRPQTLAGV